MLCQGRLHHALCTYHALLLILNSICLPLTLLVPTLARVGAESLNNIMDYFLGEGWAKEFSNHVWTIILACKCMGDNACMDSPCCHHMILDAIHVPSVPVQALKSILEVGNGMFNPDPDSRERVVEEMQVAAFLSSYV
ncbi:uncharacterized protein UHOD_11960 [Ustilago sp. UG-2017b]|nr:uncharacterized protein UHOD_11956 [Ustilago sp. UG-2017b]SPC64599.1 uncharacterized protein UHOD_11960 [Ustilago sp. UG-2017b]